MPLFVISLLLPTEDSLSRYDFPSDILQDPEFGATFDFNLELDAKFGVEFSFDDAFGGFSVGSWLFEYDKISCELSVEHMVYLW